jgi:antitoxin (DNA-binding transcriptional repressor) of toxin-antitoxin stability system
MKAVGIKILKDNLSKYLKMVREGETIWVTDRDEVIAEIHRPTRPLPPRISAWEAFLNEEERRGGLIRARTLNPPSLSRLKELPRPREKLNLQNLIDSIKGD